MQFDEKTAPLPTWRNTMPVWSRDALASGEIVNRISASHSCCCRAEPFLLKNLWTPCTLPGRLPPDEPSLPVNLNVRPLLVLAHPDSYDFFMAFPGDREVHTSAYQGIFAPEAD